MKKQITNTMGEEENPCSRAGDGKEIEEGKGHLNENILNFKELQFLGKK